MRKAWICFLLSFALLLSEADPSGSQAEKEALIYFVANPPFFWYDNWKKGGFLL